MGKLEAVVARLPGAVLAVDDGLRVLALNPGAEKALGVSSSEAVGRACHELMSATDAETGRPCHEQCPLLRDGAGPGFAFNRIIESDWDGEPPTRLDCFLLKAQVPDGPIGRFCFLEPYSPSKTEAYLKGLQLGQSFYPLVSASSGLDEAVSISLKAVVRATRSDAAELMLVDPETSEPYLVKAFAADDGVGSTTTPSTHSGGLLSMVARAEMPMVVLGTPPQDDATGRSDWHMSVPIAIDGRAAGALGVSTRQDHLNVAEAFRMLFSVALHLGLYLSRALHPDARGRKEGAGTNASETARLRFQCFGTFQLTVDGEPIPVSRFKRMKAATNLKYLVTHQGGPVARESLAEALWPGVDSAKANANLRVTLHALRRGLEPSLKKGQPSSFIATRGDLVYLEPSVSVWVDTDEFSRRVRSVAKLALDGRNGEALKESREAILLYRGEYLEDEPYSDWCYFERARLREIHLDLLRLMSAF